MDNWMIIKLSCVGAVAIASAIWILYLMDIRKIIMRIWNKTGDWTIKYNYIRK